MPRKVGVLAWLVVVLVGALVVGLVYGLRLPSRLSAGQRVVNNLKPVFTPARAQGDATGIGFVSAAVNVLDPVMTSQGTAASEVPKLIGLVSAKTGLSQATVVATLHAQFPHTLALLQSVPLSAVTAELPGFLDFVAATLKVSTPQLVATMQSSFPHLYQAVNNLPTVTNGWDNVPGVPAGMTRFNGAPVKTAPQIRDYFVQDVVPIIPKHVSDFHRVASYWPPVKYIPDLLLVIGGIAILYGLLMMLRSATATVKKKEAKLEFTVVLLLGVIVLGIVFGAQIYPRLDGGSHLLRDARPAFVPARVTGTRAGVDFISRVVNLADPLMNDQGGAAADIGKLLTTVSGATKLSPTQVLAAVTAKFPHTAALLQALPLSAVNAELPGVLQLVHIVLNQSPADVLKTLQANVPGLAQAITNLPAVVSGWDNYPGGHALTRFNGSPVMTAPQLRDYFSSDVVTSVQKVAPDFRKLDGISPDLMLFPGLLTVLGILVVIYGLIMLLVLSGPTDDERLARERSRGAARRARPASAFG